MPRCGADRLIETTNTKRVARRGISIHYMKPCRPQFSFGTKAETLERLKPVIQSGLIDPLIWFQVSEWLASPELILDAIAKNFSGQIIIRSSACEEDGTRNTMAGSFCSIPDVTVSDHESVREGINKVIASYGRLNGDDQVLVQTYLDSPSHSGVLFSCDLVNSAPYYKIEYVENGRTDLVTSGQALESQTWTVARSVAKEKDVLSRLPDGLAKVLEVAQELEQLTHHKFLDIEYAITNDKLVHIFQVRRLPYKPSKYHDVRVLSTEISRWHQSTAAKDGRMLERRLLLSDMADWNPVEMIGAQPRPFAVSLYEYLITDMTWAIQRDQFGYRDIRGVPLMCVIGGHPYIDVNASFNSFIPKGVENGLSKRLISAYQEKLSQDPSLHDKIEFEVAFTCLDFSLTRRLRDDYHGTFSKDERVKVTEALQVVTQNAFRRTEDDLRNLNNMHESSLEIKRSQDPSLHNILGLLQHCKDNAVLLFAHLARSAFVATSLIRSLKTRGILDDELEAEINSGIGTVAKQFRNDLRVAQETGRVNDFLKIYGHLRPGTYEITSKSYRESADFFESDGSTNANAESLEAPRSWPKELRNSAQLLINELRLDVSAIDLESFWRSAIEGRERAKFVFTKQVSASLDLLVEFGLRMDLPREDLSFLRMDDLLKLAGSSESSNREMGKIKEKIIERRQRQVDYQIVSSPQFIKNVTDVFCFRSYGARPTFIGLHSRTAKVSLVVGSFTRENLDEKIVLLERGDPGFDWIFKYKIVGLVTAYGGANSHMAIRAAEFGLSAAIGIGIEQFSSISRSSILEVDCAAQKIRVIR